MRKQDRVTDIRFLPDDVEPFVGGRRTSDKTPFALFRTGDSYTITRGGGSVATGVAAGDLAGRLRSLILGHPWSPDTQERSRVAFLKAHPDVIATAPDAVVQFQHTAHLDAPAASTTGAQTGGSPASVPWKGLAIVAGIGIAVAALFRRST